MRSLNPLFLLLTHLLARNQGAAQRSVDEIISNINKGNVHPKIASGCISAGICKKENANSAECKNGGKGGAAGGAGGKKGGAAAGGKKGGKTKSRRDLYEREAAKGGAKQGGGKQGGKQGGQASLPGGKGGAHDIESIVQHMMTPGAYWPARILEALEKSKCYELSPKGKSMQAGGGKGGAKGGAAGGKKGGKTKSRRDAEAEAEFDFEDIYARDFDESFDLEARDFEDSFDIEARELDDLEIRELHEMYVRETGAKITLEQMASLVKAMDRSGEAKTAVLHALNMDPNVASVTQQLVEDWVKPEDKAKRDLQAMLEAREAEAEAEYEFEDALF